MLVCVEEVILFLSIFHFKSLNPETNEQSTFVSLFCRK